MPKIEKIRIRKILDSRGNPTVELDVYAENGIKCRAAAPSGASKGSMEVKEYPNDGIDFAIGQAIEKIVPKIIGNDIATYQEVDKILHEIDGTTDFSKIGGNIAVVFSLGVAKAAAKAENMELYQFLLGKNDPVMPFPLGNIIGGGKHAVNGTTMQEFLSVSFGKTYSNSAFANVMVHKRVGELLKKKFPGIPLGLGDEKAWVAMIDDAGALGLVSEAVSAVSKEVGFDLFPAIDMAATNFYTGARYEYNNGKRLTTEEQIDFVSELAEKFSVNIIEDPLTESDFDGLAALTRRIGNKTMIVGDDIFVTNKERLKEGIRKGAANAILIKPNQIGTLSDMIETVKLAKKNNYETVISHRSGETEDFTIAHLAVGLGIKYIKTGTIGGERTAKHNELIRIEEAIWKK